MATGLARWLFPVPPAGRAAVGLLVLRTLAGVALVMHGTKKIANPLHWMDAGSWAAPAPLQMLAAVSEYFGGIALVLGLLTPLAAFGVMCTMIVAMGSHISKGDPYIGKWELAALYAGVAWTLILVGPGKFSLDAWIARRFRE